MKRPSMFRESQPSRQTKSNSKGTKTVSTIATHLVTRMILLRMKWVQNKSMPNNETSRRSQRKRNQLLQRPIKKCKRNQVRTCRKRKQLTRKVRSINPRYHRLARRILPKAATIQLRAHLCTRISNLRRSSTTSSLRTSKETEPIRKQQPGSSNLGVGKALSLTTNRIRRANTRRPRWSLSTLNLRGVRAI